MPFNLHAFSMIPDRLAVDSPDLFCLDELCCNSSENQIEEIKKNFNVGVVLWMSRDVGSKRTSLALRFGAFDFISLPPIEVEILLRLRRCLEFCHLIKGIGEVNGAENKNILFGQGATADAGTLFELPKAMTTAEKLKALGRMAAGVGNEISNPLTTISAYAQLLSLHMKDKTSIEYAEKIHKGVKRIHHIVNNLTGFANPANESFFPIDLNNVLEETLSFCEYEIKLDEIELVKSIQVPLPKILGSKEQLSQLILALLTNARDALGGRGVIEICTKLEDGFVRLEVRDNGVGIDESNVEKIFEPFYTTKPVGHGTGLGLFVAMGIAKNHGGDLTASGRPGAGAEFALNLPPFSS